VGAAAINQHLLGYVLMAATVIVAVFGFQFWQLRPQQSFQIAMVTNRRSQRFGR
jgi:hypothetical protein